MRNLKPKFELLEKTKRLYQISNPLIGLTGGIATGKSLASKILKEKGFKVLDADKLVHEIYALPDTLYFIQKLAPKCTKMNDGITNIDFKLLRQLFFSDKDLKEQIEEYIYSKLPNLFLNSLNDINDHQVVFYDVPLLFEKEINNKTDLNIVIYAPRETQLRRVVARDQINEDLAQKILLSQIPIEDKKKTWPIL